MSAFLRSWSGILPSPGRQRNADADADDQLVAGDLVGRANRLDHAAGEHGDGRRLAIAQNARSRIRRRPSRATVSVARTHSPRRAATALSSASPTGCPSESLTSLKWSRSRQRTASCSRAWRAAAPFRAARGTGSGWADWSAGHGAPCARSVPAPPPFGDVFEGRDPSAARHGLIDHAERTSVAAHRPGQLCRPWRPRSRWRRTHRDRRPIAEPLSTSRSTSISKRPWSGMPVRSIISA